MTLKMLDCVVGNIMIAVMSDGLYILELQPHLARDQHMTIHLVHMAKVVIFQSYVLVCNFCDFQSKFLSFVNISL